MDNPFPYSRLSSLWDRGRIERLANRTRRFLRRMRLIAPEQTESEGAFPGSAQYWEQRYAGGGDSGNGSYGKCAKFKAQVINRFVSEHGIESAMELGAGDGNQLAMLRIPQYVGLDISSTAIERLKRQFATDPSKQFCVVENQLPDTAQDGSFDLTMSLDVIYHLIEDDVFDQYMRNLFAASSRFVLIYASNHDETMCSHVRHRCFTEFVERELPNWKLLEKIDNPFKPKSPSDFFIYERSSATCEAAA